MTTDDRLQRLLDELAPAVAAAVAQIAAMQRQIDRIEEHVDRRLDELKSDLERRQAAADESREQRSSRWTTLTGVVLGALIGGCTWVNCGRAGVATLAALGTFVAVDSELRAMRTREDLSMVACAMERFIAAPPDLPRDVAALDALRDLGCPPPPSAR